MDKLSLNWRHIILLTPSLGMVYIAPLFFLTLGAFIILLVIALRELPKVFDDYIDSVSYFMLSGFKKFPFLIYFSCQFSDAVLRRFQKQMNIPYSSRQLYRICLYVQELLEYNGANSRYERFVYKAKLGYHLAYFLTEVAPFLNQKLPVQKISLKGLAKWFQIYLHHKGVQLSGAEQFKSWLALRHIPFKHIFRNLPSWGFLNDNRSYEYTQELFIHLAAGKNIRTLFPYQLMSRKMAHHFVNMKVAVPSVQHIFMSYLNSLDLPQILIDYLDEMQFNYHQIGGKATTLCHLVNQVIRFDEDESIAINHVEKARNLFNKYRIFLANESVQFNNTIKEKSLRFFIEMELLNQWKPILLKMKQWLEANPNLQAQEFAPILAYYSHCQEEGISLQIQGRTFESILRLYNEWQEEINRQNDLQNAPSNSPFHQGVSWEGSPILNYYYSENKRKFCIQQLTTQKQLIEEGHQMKHCVATYTGRCYSGEISIWSLREIISDKETTSLVTIELDNQHCLITQMKGQDNLPPISEYVELIQAWASKEKIIMPYEVIEEEEDNEDYIEALRYVAPIRMN